MLNISLDSIMLSKHNNPNLFMHCLRQGTTLPTVKVYVHLSIWIMSTAASKVGHVRRVLVGRWTITGGIGRYIADGSMYLKHDIAIFTFFL